MDVLPALDDDRELTRHLHEYFGEEGFPLSRPLVAFGPQEPRRSERSAPNSYSSG